VHYTREPIIESILSARDGFKLVLKNSKTVSSQEISAEVIEIVSFAGAVFYRSQDRSKNFLVPASDFEIAEVKDARLVLKNISLEKSSKLQNPPKESSFHDQELDMKEEVTTSALDENEAATSSNTQSSSQNNRMERRRERRRNRRRRHNEDRQQDDKKDVAQEDNSQEPSDSFDGNESSQAPMPIPTLNLIPPPTTLISQTLARYKDKQQDIGPIESISIVVEESSNSPSLKEPLEPEDLV
jgi:hypothetical protein